MTLHQSLKELYFIVIPKLRISIFQLLKFTKSNKIKIITDVTLFQLLQFSQKTYNLIETIASSRSLENLIIERLNPKTISNSWKGLTSSIH